MCDKVLDGIDLMLLNSGELFVYCSPAVGGLYYTSMMDTKCRSVTGSKVMARFDVNHPCSTVGTIRVMRKYMLCVNTHRPSLHLVKLTAQNGQTKSSL